MSAVAEELDVVIIGAGISGIGAAVHLLQRRPGTTFTILERRPRVGGTWDLFRYPGVRSDSDMYTLGFRFKPWTQEKAIADGPAILDYLRETVREHELESAIRFEHQVTRASWSSEDARWTLDVSAGPDAAPRVLRAKMLFSCTGYYDYDKGYTPEFIGRDRFRGPVVHPQHWPQDLDYTGKRVVVIGSGATAVTLVPALADSGAGHVVMLQRSPTYMVARPAVDRVAATVRKVLPARAAYVVNRWKNIVMGQFFFGLARSKPEKVKAKLLEGVRAELGPDADIATHFTPRYNPWDQRLCLVPDHDFFRTLRDQSTSVVTGEIASFTESGIELANGEHVDADIIVTATGLNLQLLGGIETLVDDVKIAPGDTVLYKGIMFSGIPNLLLWFGYTNASWTLKADLTSEFACRLLDHLDATGSEIVCAHSDPGMPTESFVDFSSGYFARAQHLLPKQGSRLPWKLHQNYLKDIRLLRRGPVADEGLVFSTAASDVSPTAEPALH
jgi:monooxygenase